MLNEVPQWIGDLPPFSEPATHCGRELAVILSKGIKPLFDCDGVITRGDSLDRPELTTSKIVPPLQAFEKIGIQLGLATSRSASTLDFLHSQNLQIAGPTILEDGQVLHVNGETIYLVSEDYRNFAAHVEEAIRTHPSWRASLEEVVRNPVSPTGEPTFCQGNYQWQGECRKSFWVPLQGNGKQERFALQTVVAPIKEIAQKYNLREKRDFVILFDRMQREDGPDLGIVIIEGMVKGKPVDKSLAAERIRGPFVIISDGFRDTKLARLAKKRGGFVIGIRGNRDVSKEPKEFLETSSDFVLKNPEELADALAYAAQILTAP